ncbi:methyl-CpG-binding domain protein 2-like [Panonychus citri]|uniref:methyl-CpG-binding domain protein 2-like n=1 Tax=Panonychus citri TaxID=50023 RepID=UPI00230760C1|nr:methyl-CpG-binding domain protein 2-like [Panonychus citri]
MECKVLPEGWKREEVSRKTGLSTGKTEVYYYSPDGTKFRSKPQLAKYLGDSVDLTSFDYRTGKINALLLRKNKNLKDNIKGVRINDFGSSLPVRRTAAICKQPVTIIKTHTGNKCKHDLKHGSNDKPKQVFWEKRLEGLRATYSNQEFYENFDLPKNMKPVGPNVGNDTALRSVATALHLHVKPITGQTAARSVLDKNPGVFIDPRQPLIAPIVITDEEIKRQEERVNNLRRKASIAVNDYEKCLDSVAD